MHPVALLSIVVVYLVGANYTHTSLVNMIEHGAKVMRDRGDDYAVVQYCRVIAYRRIRTATILWPFTLLEMAWLHIQIARGK